MDNKKIEEKFVNSSMDTIKQINKLNEGGAKAVCFTALLTLQLLGKEAMDLYEKVTNIYIKANAEGAEVRA